MPAIEGVLLSRMRSVIAGTLEVVLVRWHNAIQPCDQRNDRGTSSSYASPNALASDPTATVMR